MLKTQSLELSYQEEEMKRMKQEANYSLDKGEITKQDHDKLISQINSEYKLIIHEILS